MILYRPNEVFVSVFLKEPDQKEGNVSGRHPAVDDVIQPRPKLPLICASMIDGKVDEFLLKLSAHAEGMNLLGEVGFHEFVFFW